MKLNKTVEVLQSVVFAVSCDECHEDMPDGAELIEVVIRKSLLDIDKADFCCRECASRYMGRHFQWVKESQQIIVEVKKVELSTDFSKNA